jgi:hypothetical protein
MTTTPSTTRPTALITGASSGIGEALAAEFARDGYDLVLAARRVDRMQALADRLQQRYPVTVTVIGADLEAAEGATRLFEQVQARGIRLSALVNNAGYGSFGEFKDAPLAPALAMMQLNMNTVVALTRLFLPDLIASRGKVLNVASTAAFQPGPYMAVYYATKAFVLSFSEAIAAELAPHGVDVTALCPGPTASGFQDKAAMGESGLVKGKALPSAEKVAASGYRALQRGQRVHVPGCRNWALANSVRVTPRRLVTALVQRMSRPAGA